MLPNIRIVMVNTTHPGNIGAAARAMRTMGLEQMVLVQPRLFPHGDATVMASGADDILAKAQVVETLEEAVAECRLVIATSARSRRLPWPMLSPREGAAKLVQEARDDAPVALVFGREKYGLLNEQLQTCHFHIQIPSDAQYGVLNVAAAVQVLCYEIRCAALDTRLPDDYEPEGGYPTHEQLELFYHHLEQTLIDVNFLDPELPRHVMPRLRRLFQRARLENLELGILRGFLKLTQQRAAEAKQNDPQT